MNNEEKVEVATGEGVVEESFADLRECFRPVAEKYGREMFALVFNAGIASQAAQVMAQLAEKHASRGGLHAIGMLSQSFNAVSNSYAKKMGWTEAELAQCDRDIGLAWKGQIVVPGQAIILDS